MLLSRFRWAAVAALFAAPLAAQERYEVRSVIPVGGFLTTPSVSASGAVTGWPGPLTGTDRPTLWTASGPTYLPIPAGSTGVAVGVNDRGWAVGTSSGGATLWKDGAAVGLGFAADAGSYASAVNDRGQVIGTTMAATASMVLKGYVWDDGRVTPLSPLAPAEAASRSIPVAINNAGLVVGTSEQAGRWGVTTAVAWENGAVRDLGIPGDHSSPADVNDRGVVVGTAFGNGAPRMFLWKDGEVTLVDGPAGAGLLPSAINNAGDVVGTLFEGWPNGEKRGFLYRDGRTWDLDELVDDPAWEVYDPFAVTDDGRIFARGQRPGTSDYRTILELAPVSAGTPGVPEPTSAVLLGLAGVGGWVARRRRGRQASTGNPRAAGAGAGRSISS